jgi:hypothetical protein
MPSTHKHLRSSTANKRPTTAIADGQLALNTNSSSPGLFFKDSTGATIIKVGPVHVGATAPNASPAVGGSTGNSAGEIWLDTGLTPNGVKIWDGSAWVNATPIGSTTVQGLLELATNAETQTGSDTARAVTPAGLQSKVSDSTTTTSSTTIASSTAVKAAKDVADAALPKAGGTMTGQILGVNGVPATAPGYSFSGDPNTGLFSPGADQLALSTAGNERLRIDSAGRLLVGTSSAANNFRLGQKVSIVGVGGGAVEHTGLGIIGYHTTTAGVGPFFDFSRSRGATDGAMTVVQANDVLGYLTYRGADGTSFLEAARIDAYVDGTPGANDMPGRLVFSTTADGASGPTERLRIDSAGDITIATGGNIKADFTNATLTSRTYFQTSTANSQTVVGALPSGTNTTSALYAFNNSTPTNASYVGAAVTNTVATIRSAITGTGTYLPLLFETNNQEQARFTTTDRYFRMATGTGGIQFKGDTAAVNALDDYEEGTWTPTLIGATTSGTGTYSRQVGRYTKIGNKVHVQGIVTWSAHTGTGVMRITGLPFTALNVTDLFSAVAFYTSNITSPANTIVQGYITHNTSFVTVTSVATGGGAAANLTMDTAGEFLVSASYIV